MGLSKHYTTSEGSVDCSAQHKKVKQWFLKPSKYSCEKEAKQRKHLGKCIFHTSTSHTTEEGNVKKECNKLLASTSTGYVSSSSSTGSSGKR
jgi:hypothetical protein